MKRSNTPFCFSLLEADPRTQVLGCLYMGEVNLTSTCGVSGVTEPHLQPQGPWSMKHACHTCHLQKWLQNILIDPGDNLQQLNCDRCYIHSIKSHNFYHQFLLLSTPLIQQLILPQFLLARCSLYIMTSCAMIQAIKRIILTSMLCISCGALGSRIIICIVQVLLLNVRGDLVACTGHDLCCLSAIIHASWDVKCIVCGMRWVCMDEFG